MGLEELSGAGWELGLALLSPEAVFWAVSEDSLGVALPRGQQLPIGGRGRGREKNAREIFEMGFGIEGEDVRGERESFF